MTDSVSGHLLYSHCLLEMHAHDTVCTAVGIGQYISVFIFNCVI